MQCQSSDWITCRTFSAINHRLLDLCLVYSTSTWTDQAYLAARAVAAGGGAVAGVAGAMRRYVNMIPSPTIHSCNILKCSACNYQMKKTSKEWIDEVMKGCWEWSWHKLTRETFWSWDWKSWKVCRDSCLLSGSDLVAGCSDGKKLKKQAKAGAFIDRSKLCFLTFEPVTCISLHLQLPTY